MTPLQTALVEKGVRALHAARHALEDGDAEAAANRAYYACFNLARAALLGEGEQPKTHSGTHNRFALLFVATGRVPEAIARTLPHAAQIRERADYDALAVTDLRAAADLLADAERFVAAVRAVVETPGG
jgi:uncharacterized protein (UPF0332 family)